MIFHDVSLNFPVVCDFFFFFYKSSTDFHLSQGVTKSSYRQTIMLISVKNVDSATKKNAYG